LDAIAKNEEIRGIIKTSALSKEKNSVGCHDPFLEKMKRTLCVRLEDGHEDVIEPHKEVRKDMQKKTKQTKIMPSFTKSSVSPSAIYSTLLNHPDTFQPRTQTSFQ
jgi:hypothetical protein